MIALEAHDDPYKGNGNHSWEWVTNGSDLTQRLRVPYGWLYRSQVMDDQGNVTQQSMCFVPDHRPNHNV